MIEGNQEDADMETNADIEMWMDTLKYLSVLDTFQTYAAEHRFVDVDMDKLVTSKPSFAMFVFQHIRDPSLDNNFAIRDASEYGCTEVVRFLLQDPRVDPTARDNCAIRYASQNGHTEVVRLLLQDPRVDPSALDSRAIRLAIENGHIEVAQLLFQDPRIYIMTVINAILKYSKYHNLMDNMTINADATLRKLLNLKEDDTLTILTLWSYIRWVAPNLRYTDIVGQVHKLDM